jgi:hypothetical protein
MHLTQSAPAIPSTATISPAVARELIHQLRNRAQHEWIQAENSENESDRNAHAARSEAFVEAAEIVKRVVQVRGG